MNPVRKSRGKKRCIESHEEDEILLDEKPLAQVTADGKYECRYCGLLFETMNAHDSHFQQIHGKAQSNLSTANQ